MSLITRLIQVAGWAVLGPQFVAILEGLPAWAVAQLPFAAAATTNSVSAPDDGAACRPQGSRAEGFRRTLVKGTRKVYAGFIVPRRLEDQF